MPNDIAFATKPEITLRQIDATLAAGVARRVVLMDAGYGADTDLRDAITNRGLPYSAGILPNTAVWPEGQGRAEAARDGPQHDRTDHDQPT